MIDFSIFAIMKKWDKIVIIALLLLSMIPSAFIILSKSNIKHGNIVIKVDGKLEKTISLSRGNINKTYDFVFGKNIGHIEVKNGKVRMLAMDKKICPKSICSETGWIDKGYQSIVCLPNKIFVQIENAEENDNIDVQSD